MQKRQGDKQRHSLKIALFCNIAPDCVIQNLNADSLYQVPLMLEEEGLCRAVLKTLGMEQREPRLAEWSAMVERERSPECSCSVAIVGKYIELHDAYLSIVEALKHAGIANKADVKINWINSETVNEHNVAGILSSSDAILVPGGFGERGIEGKIVAVKYARENNIPFLGICLGMQMAVIEFARNVLGLADASSSEVNPKTPHPVIDIMPDQIGNIDNIGGTLRLGGYDCRLSPDSIAHKAYNSEIIRERHRHRYEFNNSYRNMLSAAGMKITGINEERDLVEIVELDGHPWFVGVQFHPEFTSRPDEPHPLFASYIKAAINNNK